MKKLLTILMLLAASLPLWAYDFEVNGLYYNKTGSSLQLTYASESYNSYSGDIVIPSTVSHDGTSYNGRVEFSSRIDQSYLPELIEQQKSFIWIYR